MPIFEEPFSIEVPLQLGDLSVTFFINQNLYVVNEECQSVPHNHHDYELRFIATGKAVHMLGTESLETGAGDLLILRPLEYHCQPEDRWAGETSQYNLRLLAESSNEKAMLAFRRAMDSNRLLHDYSGKFCTYLELIADEMFARHTGYISNVKSLGTLLLTEVLRAGDADMSQIFHVEDLYYHGFSRSKLDSFFQKRYTQKIKIEELAADMKVSPRQVNYIMHRMFGMSFTQKLLDMRLQKALSKLTYGDRAVQDIAMDCGFKNQNYFAICFRKKYGISPSEYRKKVKRTERSINSIIRQTAELKRAEKELQTQDEEN